MELDLMKKRISIQETSITLTLDKSFLAAALELVGYPDLVTAFQKDSLGQIELIYMAPRVLMGVLAEADTFLVFKIAECVTTKR